MQTGLVIRTTGSWYKVLSLTTQEVVDCRLRGVYRLQGSKQTNPVAVGDRVGFTLQDDGTGCIHEVADRRNYIVRRATNLSKQTHVIAANIDMLCIVATLAMPRTSTGFIDRMLATSEAYHIPACIVFNKGDLLDTVEARQEQEALCKIYRTVGYPVLEVSALTGYHVEDLKRLISGKTVLFSGHSGVGKSALLNAVCPMLDLRVGSISQWSQKGTHTTTFAEIFPVQMVIDGCEQQTLLVDTPGIKEFGLVAVSPQELGHFFPEIRRELPACRFSNCTHRHEPGCAVKEALTEGRVAAERYTNYLNILESLVSE